MTGSPAPVMACFAIVLAAAALLTGCANGDGVAPAATTSQAPVVTSTPDAAESTPAATAVPQVPRSDASIGASGVEPTVQPVRVTVASQQIDVAVAAEGVDSDGALALPADPGVASWYQWGPSPWSAAGATVIASHVDSLDYGIGQFARLADTPVGTAVRVEAADGRTADFVIDRVELLDKTGIDWATVFDRTGPPRLVLITCGGEFDYDTGHYLSNVIVTAVPAG